MDTHQDITRMLSFHFYTCLIIETVCAILYKVFVTFFLYLLFYILDREYRN